jgi:hypothetical protein
MGAVVAGARTLLLCFRHLPPFHVPGVWMGVSSLLPQTQIANDNGSDDERVDEPKENGDQDAVVLAAGG